MPLTRSLIALLAGGLVAIGPAGCGTQDTIEDEVDAQKRRVTTVIQDPIGAVDREIERRLRQRGVDGIAP